MSYMSGLHERPYLDPWPACPQCGVTAEVSWQEILLDGPQQERAYIVTALSCPANCRGETAAPTDEQ